MPISFVTEHIETLHEINIEARDEAKKVGIETVPDDASRRGLAVVHRRTERAGFGCRRDSERNACVARGARSVLNLCKSVRYAMA